MDFLEKRTSRFGTFGGRGAPRKPKGPKQKYEVEFDLVDLTGSVTEHQALVWAQSAYDAEQEIKSRYPGCKNLYAEPCL